MVMGDETHSNLHQLLVLWGEDYPAIHQFLESQHLKYTTHEVQNELLSIIALQVLRRIAAQIQSAVFYTVIVDEATDCSNKEQVVVFRWVGEDLVAHDDFLDCTSLKALLLQPWWPSLKIPSCA